MLDAHGEHQRTTPAVLRHLPGGIAVTLHKGHKTGGSKCRIVHRTSFRPDVAQIVPHSTATLHQLHLLFVNAHDGTIGVGIAIEPYHETVAQRCHLMAVADAGHRTAGRNDVTKMVEQTENLFFRQRIGILALNACYLAGNAPVHVFGRFLEDVAEAVLHRILVDPHTGGQLVATKIFKRGGKGLLIRIRL